MATAFREPDELSLRRHIRTLLLDYALQHLTIDHVAFTEQVVPQFLQEHLKPVTLSDPASLSVPDDPIDTLLRFLDKSKPEPFDEKWSQDAEASAFIVNTVKYNKLFPEECKTSRVMKDDDPEYRPALDIIPLPLLSRESRRLSLDTSARAAKARLRTFPATLVQHLDHLGSYGSIIAPLRSDEEEIVMEETLHVTLRATAEDIELTEKFIPSTLTMNSLLGESPLAETRVSAVHAFLRADSPPPVTLTVPLSPPIFSRSSKLPRPNPSGVAQTSQSPGNSLAQFLHNIVQPIEVEDGKMDYANENMTVIDGWATYLSSPSPKITTSNPPSLTSKSSSHDDQLDDDIWSPSPTPEVPFLDVAIVSARIDDFVIPRIHRPGRGTARTPVSPSVLKSFLQPIPMTPPRKLLDQDDRREQLSPSIAGQPRTDDGISQNKDEMLDPNDLDATLKFIYRPILGQEADSIIMDAKVDENEALYMNVPRLPEPNVHPVTGPPLPVDFDSILAPFKSGAKYIPPSPKIAQTAIKGSGINLKKVGGLAPLNIELSWRPSFTASSVPTHDELAHATSVFSKSDPPDISEVVVSKHLDDFQATVDSPSPRRFQEDQMLPPALEYSLGAPHGLLLTKAELEQASKTSARGRSSATRSRRTSQIDFAKQCQPSPSDNDSSPSPPHAHIFDASRNLDTSAPSGLAEIDYFPQRQPLSIGPPPPLPDMSSRQPSYSLIAFDSPMRTTNNDLVLVPRSPDLTHSHTDDHVSGILEESSPSSVLPSSPDYRSSRLSKGASAKPLRSLTPHSQAPIATMVSLSARDAVSLFLRMRGKADSEPESHSPEIIEPEEIVFQKEASPATPETFETPSELLDPDAISLHEPWEPPRSRHRYVASLKFIQKRGITVSLLSPLVGAIDFVERGILQSDPAQDDEDPDLILDPNTAVIFAHLAQIPSTRKALFSKIKRLSWSFDFVLLVFEAYPMPESYTPQTDVKSPNNGSNPFNQAVRDAVKKLRRELSIASGLDELCPGTRLDVVFARSPTEAAKYTRTVGDLVELYCPDELRYDLWMNRSWLNDEETADERDLARFPRMNLFAAILILSRVSLSELLEMESSPQFESLALLVGEDRMRFLYNELFLRLQQFSDLSLPPSSPSPIYIEDEHVDEPEFSEKPSYSMDDSGYASHHESDLTWAQGGVNNTGLVFAELEGGDVSGEPQRVLPRSSDTRRINETRVQRFHAT